MFAGTSVCASFRPEILQAGTVKVLTTEQLGRATSTNVTYN